MSDYLPESKSANENELILSKVLLAVLSGLTRSENPGVATVASNRIVEEKAAVQKVQKRQKNLKCSETITINIKHATALTLQRTCEAMDWTLDDAVENLVAAELENWEGRHREFLEGYQFDSLDEIQKAWAAFAEMDGEPEVAGRFSQGSDGLWRIDRSPGRGQHARAVKEEYSDPEKLRFPLELVSIIGLSRNEILFLRRKGCKFVGRKTCVRWVREFLNEQAEQGDAGMSDASDWMGEKWKFEGQKLDTLGEDKVVESKSKPQQRRKETPR